MSRVPTPATSVQMSRPRLRRSSRSSVRALTRCATWVALTSALAWAPAAANPAIAVKPDHLPLIELPVGQLVPVWFTLSNLDSFSTAPLRWVIGDVVRGTEEDCKWVNEYPLSGAVPPADSDFVAVTFNTMRLAGGTYTIDLRIDSNDSVRPRVVIPVTIRVVVPAGVRSLTLDGLDALRLPAPARRWPARR